MRFSDTEGDCHRNYELANRAPHRVSSARSKSTAKDLTFKIDAFTGEYRDAHFKIPA
jgi:hypothetical protein